MLGNIRVQKSASRDTIFIDVALLGLLAAVLGLANKLVRRAVLGVLTC